MKKRIFAVATILVVVFSFSAVVLGENTHPMISAASSIESCNYAS